MATLTIDEIKHLAKLSHLVLTDEELDSFQKELNSILDYVTALQSIQTDGVEPTAQVTGLTNVMRADEEIDYGTSRDTLLSNAPAQEKGYIKVHRVLGEK